MESEMADFSDRDVHLLKKALAISVLVIDRGDGPFQSASDGGDMKLLLDRLIQNDQEMEFYTKSALIAVDGHKG